MHLKVLVISTLIPGICSCASHTVPLAEIQKEPEINEVNFAQCPKIDGFYYSLGTLKSSNKNYYQNPILEKQYAGMYNIASPDNFVKIESDRNSFNIHITVYDKRKNEIGNKVFNTPYQCNNGWIITTSYVEGGSGENPLISSLIIARKKISNDRSSLINSVRIETISRIWLFGRKKSSTEVEYRYKKVKGTY